MAALLLQVGSLDLTTYVRAAPDEGLAPDGGGTFLEPVFAGSLALSEGQVAVGESASNRELGAPLWLHATTTDGVLALLQQLRQACVRGAQVQFRPNGGSNISYLDLEAAEIHPVYSHFPLRSGWLKVNVLLKTRPYASTGTTRLVASVSGTGVFTVDATGILGDVNALANLRLTSVPSIVSRVSGEKIRHVLFYGVHRSASFNPLLHAVNATFRFSALGDASVYGAAYAQGSQYVGVASYLNQPLDFAMTPPDAYTGRYRAILLAHHSAHPATTLSYRLSVDGRNPLPTAIPTIGNSAGSAFNMVDLGDFEIPKPSGSPAASRFLRVTPAIATLASIIALPVYRVNALVLIPLDISAGIVGPDGDSAYILDEAHVEAVPALNVHTKTASQPYISRLNAFRGALPALPPTGSPVASGPAKIAILQGNCQGFRGNDPAVQVAVEVRERFTFLR